METFTQTARLRLRRFRPSDVDNLTELDADPEVTRYINGGRPTPREQVEQDVLPRFLWYYDTFPAWGFYAAEERSTGDFLGWFHLRPGEGAPPDEPELGYRLRRAAWGKGYATEGSRALVVKAFTELDASRVTAWTMAVNNRSRRVMEKSGLRLVRIFHVDWDEPIEGTEHGEVEYAVTRAEYEAQSDAFRSA